jgi:cellulose synthase (UDP-forming)
MAVALWALVRYAVFLFTPAHVGQPIAYELLVVAEVIAMVQFFGIWATILLGGREERRWDVIAIKRKLDANPAVGGKIAVFVTTAGEPIELVRQTAIAARDLDLNHDTYILDDGESEEVVELASQLGIRYLSRPEKDGRKAGNVNYALEHVDADYVALFDCDHVPLPEFLHETLPYLLADQHLAFVQTPQAFRNTDGFIAGGTSEAQEVFYRHVQTGKNRFGAAFCVGTNVLFRTKALREVGGLYADSASEDIWTSILLHERGWKSFYIPTVLAHGLAPDTVDSFFRQQFRWARGGFEVLFRRFPLLRRNLSLDQKLQYFHTLTHFLSGISSLIFFVLPLLYVYLDWRPLAVSGSQWAWYALPYLGMIVISIIHLLGRLPTWRALVVGATAFPAHIGALIAVLTGLNIRWSATGVIRTNIDYVKAVAPQLLLLLLSVGAIPVLAFTADFRTGLPLLMIGWLVFNGSLLLSICLQALPQFRASPALASSPVLAS